MATWYYAGVDKTGHKCPYCCDAFVSGVGGCGLICVSDADPAWTCVPPPFGDECFVYRKNSASAPFSAYISWNSWYFGSSQTLSCYPSSIAPPCVNSAGWSVVGSTGGNCSGIAYAGFGGCGSGIGCSGCSQTTPSISFACTGPGTVACEDAGCYTYTGANAFLPYCRGCTMCSYSAVASCYGSCHAEYEGCAAECGCATQGCPPFYFCDETNTCVSSDCFPVTGSTECGICYELTCAEDAEGDIGVCTSAYAPSCDSNHYLTCTCLGWECLCNSSYAACCTETNPDGATEGQPGWTNVSHGRCRPCFWPAVGAGTNCCSRNGGTYEQKHCSRFSEGCCPDGRCYPSAQVMCRYDISNYSPPCGDAESYYA